MSFAASLRLILPSAVRPTISLWLACVVCGGADVVFGGAALPRAALLARAFAGEEPRREVDFAVDVDRAPGNARVWLLTTVPFFWTTYPETRTGFVAVARDVVDRLRVPLVRRLLFD